MSIVWLCHFTAQVAGARLPCPDQGGPEGSRQLAHAPALQLGALSDVGGIPARLSAHLLRLPPQPMWGSQVGLVG